jgi:NAD(P)H dehydrogenase (quinone)
MILVTGAMGRSGTAAVAALHQRGVPTRALVPTRRCVPWLAEYNAELSEGDCDDAERLDRALADVSAVILISRPSAEQVEVQRRVIEACAERGIARVVKLSVAGAREDSDAEAARWHWRAEQHLLSTVAEPCIARAGRTMQDLLHQTPLLLAHHMLVGCQGTGAAADVDARDVGAVLAGLATTNDVPGEPLLVTGPAALSRQDVAALLGQALHIALRYVSCTPLELEQVLLGAGISKWQVDDLVSYEAAAADGHWQEVTDVVPRWSSRPARAFPAFAHELATSLRYQHFMPAWQGPPSNAQMPEVALADA